MTDFLTHPAVLLVLGAIVGAVVSSIGWLVKQRSQRAAERRQFLNSRIEPRDEGFAKILATVNALQFLKADAHLGDGAADAIDHEE